jgi:hypothetical protein
VLSPLVTETTPPAPSRESCVGTGGNERLSGSPRSGPRSEPPSGSRLPSCCPPHEGGAGDRLDGLPDPREHRGTPTAPLALDGDESTDDSPYRGVRRAMRINTTARITRTIAPPSSGSSSRRNELVEPWEQSPFPYAHSSTSPRTPESSSRPNGSKTRPRRRRRRRWLSVHQEATIASVQNGTAVRWPLCRRVVSARKAGRCAGGPGRSRRSEAPGTEIARPFHLP